MKEQCDFNHNMAKTARIWLNASVTLLIGLQSLEAYLCK
jgi:hypothetical protein